MFSEPLKIRGSTCRYTLASGGPQYVPTACVEEARVITTEAIARAQQQAQRKYAIAAKKIGEASDQWIREEQNRQAAKGSLLCTDALTLRVPVALGFPT
jgi:hypothetical protein